MTDADNAVTVTLLRDAAGWIEMLAYSEACATAADTIERQGNALRAVAELAQRWRRDINPANQVDKNDPFYDEGIEDSADELEKTLKAALAQTEPQTADEAKENTLDG